MSNPAKLGLKVAMFEDDESIAKLVEMNLMHTPHEIVDTAKTLDEALDVLNKDRPERLDLDVVLLDGKLSTPKHGHDALTIWDRLVQINQTRRRLGELVIVTVGISADPLRDYGIPLPQQQDITKDGLADIEDVLDDIAERRRAS